MPCLFRRSAFAVLLMPLALLRPAGATEFTLLAAGAAKAPVLSMAKVFQYQTGHLIDADFAGMGLLREKLGGGDHADVIITTSEFMGELEKQGRIVAGTRTPLGEVGIGVAVRDKGPVPDVSTPDKLREVLLRAKSLVYVDPTRGTSGRYVADILDQLGIAAEVKRKSLLLAGGYVVEPVGTGEIEIGLHQISEILPVKGVRLAGPVPPPLQRLTSYDAAVMEGSRPLEAAIAFVHYMTSSDGRDILSSKGFSPAPVTAQADAAPAITPDAAPAAGAAADNK